MKSKPILFSYLLLLVNEHDVNGFIPTSRQQHQQLLHRSPTSLMLRTTSGDHESPYPSSLVFPKWLLSTVVASALLLHAPIAFADEYGREVEAPTVFTGENVMICKKRGPLGACLETVQRTEENDNDRAKKYFRSEIMLLRPDKEDVEAEQGNLLIQRLKQQSEENKEKNDLYVQRKTFENDQSATFGPFDKQVLILNTDGKSFTLLENPQAMRLKKAGFIKDRSFIKQPTEEEIEAALDPDFGGGGGGGIGGLFQGIFGGN